MRYIKTTILGKATHIQEFDSISDLRHYLKSSPEKSTLWANTYLASGGSDSTSYQEADELLRTGWLVQAEKLAKKVPVKTVQATVRKSAPSFGMVGHQASVPRYIMGVPQSMINNKPIEVKQKIIVINKCITFSGSISTDQIEEEGVKCLQIIQALEGKGYRIKLNIIEISEASNQIALCKVCIKKPEERLSLIKIAFPIAHPSMLRIIMFRQMEKFEQLTDRGFLNGYGRPTNDYKHLLKKGEYLLPNFIDNVEEYVANMGL